MGTQIPKPAARRLLLRAQGLSGRRPAAGLRGLAATITKLGYVQLDSINVVARAHELILHSRLPDYRQEDWHSLLRGGQLFEHWTHDAAMIPSAFLPYWLTRFERDAHRIQANRWWQERLGGEAHSILDRVKAELRRRGPLLARDFPTTREKSEPGGQPGWWNWKPEKAALEYLWRTGQLMVVERRNFHKVYQLTELHLPELGRMQPPPRSETVDWACREAVRRLGLATPAQLASFWGLVSLAEARQWCASLPQADCVAVLDPAGRNAAARADWQEAAEEAAPARSLRLLAPFDPILRDRARAQLLFDFDFRFEAFVPQHKRVHGYYTLPILDGDRLVGRITPKFERRQRLLDVLGVQWESAIPLSAARLARLDEALERLAAFVGAERIRRPW